MARTLPPLDEFAAQVARALGGETQPLSEQEHDKASAIAFGGHHLLLVRDHGWTLTLSLPLEGSWSLQTSEEWSAAEPKVRRAVASCKRIVTMSDVVLALRTSFARLAPSFPGTPVPSEAWMKSEGESVGLFQSTGGVRIVVWIDRAASQRTVASLDDLESLPAWLGPELDKQRAANEAAEAEAKRRAALPVPALEAVLAHLRAGHRISTSGGRSHETFFFEDGRLCREIVDEGFVEVRGASEDNLRKAIEWFPDRFRDALG